MDRRFQQDTHDIQSNVQLISNQSSLCRQYSVNVHLILNQNSLRRFHPNSPYLNKTLYSSERNIIQVVMSSQQQLYRRYSSLSFTVNESPSRSKLSKHVQ